MCALLLTIFFTAPISLAANDSSISQGFHTTDPAVAPGAMVSVKQGSTDNVELANQDNNERIIGVVGDKPLLSLSEGGTSVQVVTSGITATFVSDINGDIKAGDKITASPIGGIGMKATSSTLVVGTAQEDLSSVKTSARQITDTKGQSHTVNVGVIPMQINVTFYAAPEDASAFLPKFLQDFANGLAGKEVSPVRVIIAAIIMLLAFMSIAVLMYASVKSSIISIGRNPLSEVSVRKSLLQIGIIVLSILLLALITIYLILST
ncbi:MAG TPA: hypothetical protein VFO38_04410 [Candidatus Saccharimonadales bacterium]|nr:hypothetical protein [Candidatus Saccharimonadales bacterium]